MSDPQRTGRLRSTFFNTFWIYGAIFMVLLGMVLRERALSLLGLIPLVTAGGSWLWARYSLDNIEYTRELSGERVFSGDVLQMWITVVNRKLLPLAWLQIEDQHSDRLRIVDRDITPSGVTGINVLRINTAMRWYEKVTWQVGVEATARGYFSVGPVTLRSADAFGFFDRRRTIPGESQIIVYPRIADLDHVIVPARHLFGDLRIRRQIITDPLRTIGVRDYRPEDSFRHVHWKATARAQALQTKVFEPSTTIQFGIFLNLDTFERYWEGLDFERAEGAIIAAATLADDASKSGNAVGMYANGVVGGSDQSLRVRPSRSVSQMEEILTGLAKLSPIASLNFPAILRAETARFPVGSTIVVITAIITDTMRAIIQALSEDGHDVVVVTIGELEVPPLRRVQVAEVDLDALREYIPRHHHYAVRMTTQPVPPIEAASD